MDPENYNLAVKLGQKLQQAGLKLAVAESCTGGLLAATITAVPGSSSYFERGFVTYSNAAKEELLGVPHDFLMKYGAVSEQVAKAMAEGALKHSKADVSIAITGIAGPDGGTKDKPVGTVCFAWAQKDKSTLVITKHFAGDREAVRVDAAKTAIVEMLGSDFLL